jgi:Patatin-like phospholipase
MSWRLIGRALRLAFLLRVPLITLLLLAALGPFSLKSSLLGNLLDQGVVDQGHIDPAKTEWYLFTVSFSAFLLAFTAITVLNLTLHYGDDRFDEGAQLDLGQRRPLLTFCLGCLAAIILDVCVYLRTIPQHAVNILCLLAGLIAALALVIFAKIVQLALTDPSTTRHPPPFLVFPAYLIPSVERFFDNIYCWSSGGSRDLKAAFNRLCQWPLEILRPAGQGYLVTVDSPNGEFLKLRSGHVFALSLSVLAFLAYLGIGVAKSRITANPAVVPALSFVLLFLIVACWSLAALAFFFDRYRFPLFWTLIVLSAITFSVPQSDHFFRVQKRDSAFAEPIDAAGYLRVKLGPGHKRLILVATPGGGIQAAAWTAQVLTGLEEQTPGFRESVALVSSVSGGSLGSIIYGASFAHKIGEDEVPTKALQPAIDEVAWGWTVPDFWRTILPWFRMNRAVDRGWALEKKWAAINNLDDTGGERGTMLADWSEAARTGSMPALIINSMLVERGQPVVFSTTRFPRDRDAKGRIANFYDLYPGQYLKYDIRVNTAARLSASFPYVAPASRPDLNGPYADAFHFVDGGYYDNFGVVSLSAWLNEALADDAVRGSVPDILILQIRHFNPAVVPGGSVQGWGFQAVAPPFALYHMRDFAQDSVARSQLEFLGKYYADHNVRVWKTSVDYVGMGATCGDAPLSWKLDLEQQECIAKSWKQVLKEHQGASENQKDALACIESYLKGGDPSARCLKAAEGKE